MRDVFWNGFADELEKLAVSESWISDMVSPYPEGTPPSEMRPGFRSNLSGAAGAAAQRHAGGRLVDADNRAFIKQKQAQYDRSVDSPAPRGPMTRQVMDHENRLIRNDNALRDATSKMPEKLRGQLPRDRDIWMQTGGVGGGRGEAQHFKNLAALESGSVASRAAGQGPGVARAAASRPSLASSLLKALRRGK